MSCAQSAQLQLSHWKYGYLRRSDAPVSYGQNPTFYLCQPPTPPSSVFMEGGPGPESLHSYIRVYIASGTTTGTRRHAWTNTRSRWTFLLVSDGAWRPVPPAWPRCSAHNALSAPARTLAHVLREAHSSMMLRWPKGATGTTSAGPRGTPLGFRPGGAF